MNTPKSGVGYWIELLGENEFNTLKKVLLKSVPYAILVSVSNTILVAWPVWKNIIQLAHVKKLQCNRDSINTCTYAEEFVDALSNEKSLVKLNDLLELAKLVNQHDTIRDCFTKIDSFREAEKERVKVDDDLSYGYMKDINEETIRAVGELVYNNTDWRLLADGLGFDNVTCRSFKHPLNMIQSWLKLYENATVKRLHFECSNLKMHTASNFLENIPLEGVPSNVVTPLITLGRLVTVYDIQKLDTLVQKNFKIDWKVVATNMCSYEVTYNNLDSYYNEHPSDLIWLSSKVNLKSLLDMLDTCNDLKPAVKKFTNSITSGLYEPENKNGVTYSQVDYMCKAYDRLRRNRTTCQEEDWSSHVKYTQSLPSAYDVSKKYSPINRARDLSVKDFMFIVWQLESFRNLDLLGLTQKYIDIFSDPRDVRTQPVEFIEQLNICYGELKPYRSHKVFSESEVVAKPPPINLKPYDMDAVEKLLFPKAVNIKDLQEDVNREYEKRFLKEDVNREYEKRFLKEKEEVAKREIIPDQSL